MSEISSEDLAKEINAILKTADLSKTSAKKVRQEVEKKLGCSLLARKKEFDCIVMDVINKQQEEDGSEEDAAEASNAEEEPSSDEDAKKKKASKRRPQPTQRKVAPKKKQRKSLNAPDSGTESDGGSDSDFELPKKTPIKKKSGSGEKTASGRKSTGFTRAYNLSPELAELMGAEALPRHEVVKKVWAIIKERDLYDPKNKQFAICDDELLKVMKVKRFRTFGMLKHLKQHFLD